LVSLSLLLNGYFITKSISNNTVVEVHDGDTFTLGDGSRVKLIGVNAPELGRCMADDAKKRLNSLVMSKIVRIADEKRDTYGRRMGLVYIGNTLVNEIMLKEGLAKPDYTPNSQSERLKSAYKFATDNDAGIHGKCKITSPVPPNPECVIKGNIETSSGIRLYHLPSCRHYKQVVLDLDMGEQYFCTENAAKDAGFSLAPDCLR
jgi:micrococcal nuclease